MGLTDPVQVLVCGGGNAAHVFAGMLSSHPIQYRVHVLSMYNHEAEHWQEVLGSTEDIQVTFDTGKKIHGRPHLVTDNPEEAIPGSDVIVLSVPSTAHQIYLEAIKQHATLKNDEHRIIVGAMPCRGGFDWQARNIFGPKMMKQVDLFGTVTLPWACRIEHWGDSANVLGTKKTMDMVVTPKENSDRVRDTLQTMLGEFPVLHCDAAVSFLSLSLLNFWHPAIVYGQFKDWDLQTPFEKKPFFYAGVTDEVAQMLIDVSDEIQNVRKTLENKYTGLNLEYTKDTQEWFTSSYAGSIEVMSDGFGAMIRSNKAYQGLTHPMKPSPTGSGFVPDFAHRYMSEDLPIGVIVIRGVAELAGVPTPQLDAIIEWCQARSNKEYLVHGKLCGRDISESRCPQRYGFDTIQSLIDAQNYL